MVSIKFKIPQTLNELLVSNGERYFVRNVADLPELKIKLEGTALQAIGVLRHFFTNSRFCTFADAKESLKEDGPAFIFEYFDMYFAAVKHAEKLDISEIIAVHAVLHTGTRTTRLALVTHNFFFVFSC